MTTATTAKTRTRTARTTSESRRGRERIPRRGSTRNALGSLSLGPDLGLRVADLTSEIRDLRTFLVGAHSPDSLFPRREGQRLRSCWPLALAETQRVSRARLTCVSRRNDPTIFHSAFGCSTQKNGVSRASLVRTSDRFDRCTYAHHSPK